MKDPRRPLLIGGLILLGAGGAAYFADMFPAAGPWLVLAGGLLVVLYFVLARLAKVPAQRQAESMLYDEGGTTMMDERDKRDG